MAEYIDRGTAIAKLTALEVIEPNATMVDARRLLADMPAADVAPVVHGTPVTEVRTRTIVGYHEEALEHMCFSGEECKDFEDMDRRQT